MVEAFAVVAIVIAPTVAGSGRGEHAGGGSEGIGGVEASVWIS